jgi:hypothetical protein
VVSCAAGWLTALLGGGGGWLGGALLGWEAVVAGWVAAVGFDADPSESAIPLAVVDLAADPPQSALAPGNMARLRRIGADEAGTGSLFWSNRAIPPFAHRPGRTSTGRHAHRGPVL